MRGQPHRANYSELVVVQVLVKKDQVVGWIADRPSVLVLTRAAAGGIVSDVVMIAAVMGIEFSG